MMHLIYIYFILNSYLFGKYVGKDMRFDIIGERIFYSLCLIFFGVILGVLVTICKLISPFIAYIWQEIRFQYCFRLTDYYDIIYLDDKYTELYDSRDKKLKRTEELSQNSSGQTKRYNKQIQKKYGK